ncbi:MAG: YbaK/EbsC family protein [Gemmatimonadota bacterium]|nr:YbaK/EbsC family protein [Gemmatimonadota bacterium]
MPIRKLKQFLDEHGVRYVTVRHSPAFTAQEVAASAHISGYEMAKTVIVKVNGQMAMAVLPAPMHVDLPHLQELIGADRVELATESEFKERFAESELGAMPPFGNLYGMDVYVADRLADDEYIAFNAGTHTELIRLRYREFEQLVRPRVLAFAL